MAAITDIFVDQGTDFTLQLSVVDTVGTAKNLTGATITAQARKDFTSANPTATFTTAPGAGEAIIFSVADNVFKWKVVWA